MKAKCPVCWGMVKIDCPDGNKAYGFFVPHIYRMTGEECEGSGVGYFTSALDCLTDEEETEKNEKASNDRSNC